MDANETRDALRLLTELLPSVAERLTALLAEETAAREAAEEFLQRCEERHGTAEVERLLDAAHALMPASVFRHRRPPQPSLREERERQRQRYEEEERAAHYLWDALPISRRAAASEEIRERKRSMHLPEENLLLFVERYSPVLKPWQR